MNNAFTEFWKGLFHQIALWLKILTWIALFMAGGKPRRCEVDRLFWIFAQPKTKLLFTTWDLALLSPAPAEVATRRHVDSLFEYDSFSSWTVFHAKRKSSLQNNEKPLCAIYEKYERRTLCDESYFKTIVIHQFGCKIPKWKSSDVNNRPSLQLNFSFMSAFQYFDFPWSEAKKGLDGL